MSLKASRSVETFADLKAGCPTQTSGSPRSLTDAANASARASYSFVQLSSSGDSRVVPIFICWRSLAPIMTTTAAGFSVSSSAVISSGQS